MMEKQPKWRFFIIAGGSLLFVMIGFVASIGTCFRPLLWLESRLCPSLMRWRRGVGVGTHSKGQGSSIKFPPY